MNPTQDLGCKSRTYGATAGNEAVLRWFKGRSGELLDLGCGAGANARALSVGGLIVDGVTISQSEQVQAARVCRRVWLHDLEGGLPTDVRGPYDFVLASHVLEHLRHPEGLLPQLSTVLKPTGLLVVALPNPLNLRNRLALLRGNIQYTDHGVMDSSHYRWFTFASGRELLEGAGFSCVEAFAEGALALGPLRRALPLRICQSLDRLASDALPGVFGFQFIYAAALRAFCDHAKTV